MATSSSSYPSSNPSHIALKYLKDNPFSPVDERLLDYLREKVQNPEYRNHEIENMESSLYNSHPLQLMLKVGKRTCFCFTQRIPYKKNGYYKAKRSNAEGKYRKVASKTPIKVGEEIVGYVEKFDFLEGVTKQETNFRMNEYTLLPNRKLTNLEDFEYISLCKVFLTKRWKPPTIPKLAIKRGRNEHEDSPPPSYKTIAEVEDAVDNKVAKLTSV